MRGMILAAGEGKRMGALTQTTPKTLLKVNGRHLIEYAIDSFVQAGIRELVINVCHFKEQIIDTLGNGARYGVKIFYSEEEERLETGGGIIKALPLLGEEPFIAISGDIITDYPLASLFGIDLRLAHLIVVENPPFHPTGDFGLNENNEISFDAQPFYTFANIGIYHPDLFAGLKPSHCRLPTIWEEPLKQGQVTGECYSGLWYNVGTPQQLSISLS